MHKGRIGLRLKCAFDISIRAKSIRWMACRAAMLSCAIIGACAMGREIASRAHCLSKAIRLQDHSRCLSMRSSPYPLDFPHPAKNLSAPSHTARIMHPSRTREDPKCTEPLRCVGCGRA